jgi:thiamine biosynthesis lipoprotein ApbE
LIDPITGKPAQNGLLSVHVLHSDIIVADILATAFFVLPMEDIDGVAVMCGAEYCLV